MLLPAAMLGLPAPPAVAQQPPRQPAAQTDRPDDGLTEEEERAVEGDLLSELPELAPIGSAARARQLEQLAKSLAERKAFCRAVEHLEEAAKLGQPVDARRSATAQLYYRCAKTKLYQGDTAAARQKLSRSVDIVGERPEHTDLMFKLALVSARDGIEARDVEAIRQGLSEAQRLGRAMGPGSGNRISDWAQPLINAAVKDVAVWSRSLLDGGAEEDRALADAASRLAVEFNPNDRIAEGVRRDIVFGDQVLPLVGGGLGVLIFGGLIYWAIRARRLKRIAAEE